MMISYGIDDKSPYRKNREIVNKYVEMNKDNPEAFEIEVTPQLQYLLAQQYCLGFTDGASQYLGRDMADKFELDNMNKDKESISKK